MSIDTRQCTTHRDDLRPAGAGGICSSWGA